MIFIKKLIKPSFKNKFIRTFTSSRNLEDQMKMQRWNNLQKNITLQKFNYKKPLPQQQYEKPTYIQYTVESLKDYSQKYPNFLLVQLNDPKSKFRVLIDQIMNEFWKLPKEEVLLFIEFFSEWDLGDKQIIKRWCENQKFSFDEIFKLLKTKFELHQVLENFIIISLQDLDPNGYQILFKILNYYRFKNLGNDTFFIAIENHILKHLKDINATNVTRLIIHYANNLNQNLQSKIKILAAVEQRVYKLSKFLSADQLISIFYSYLKLDLATQPLIRQLQEKIIQSIDQFDTRQIINILNLCSSLQRKHLIPLISHIINRFMVKNLPIEVIPTLFIIAIQNSLTSTQFMNKIQPILISNVFNMKPDDVSKCVWGFAVIQQQKSIYKVLNIKQQNYKIFYKKGGLRDYKISEIAMIVWSFSIKSFQQKAQFWNQIQSWILEQLNSKQITSKQISLILWAYTNHRTLKFKTIDKINKLYLGFQSENLEPFDLSMISWFFSSLSLPIQYTNPILSKTYQRFLIIFQEMSIIQILKCVRWFQMRIKMSQQIQLMILNRVNDEYMSYSYEILVNLLNIITVFKVKDQSKVMSLTIKIYKRIQELKILVMNPDLQNAKDQEQILKEQISINEMRKKFKQQK